MYLGACASKKTWRGSRECTVISSRGLLLSLIKFQSKFRINTSSKVQSKSKNSSFYISFNYGFKIWLKCCYNHRAETPNNNNKRMQGHCVRRFTHTVPNFAMKFVSVYTGKGLGGSQETQVFISYPCDVHSCRKNLSNRHDETDYNIK